jgi:hypothetical protein
LSVFIKKETPFLQAIRIKLEKNEEVLECGGCPGSYKKGQLSRICSTYLAEKMNCQSGSNTLLTAINSRIFCL